MCECFYLSIYETYTSQFKTIGYDTYPLHQNTSVRQAQKI